MHVCPINPGQLLATKPAPGPEEQGRQDLDLKDDCLRNMLAKPLALETLALKRCRHPHERLALALSILVILGSVLLALRLGRADVIVTLAGIWAAMFLTSLSAKTYDRLRGAEVTETQFPDLYRLVKDVGRRLDTPTTRVFVIRRSEAGAHAYGFRAPYVLVLYSDLLDTLSPDELKTVVGFHMARITYGHTRVALLLGGDESTLPAVLSWLAWARNLVFVWYRRLEVLSADRGAVLVSRDLNTAFQTCVKLSVGTAQAPSVIASELIEQARKTNRRRDRMQTGLITLQSATPPLLLRLEAMIEWSRLSAPREKPPRTEEALHAPTPQPTA